MQTGKGMVVQTGKGMHYCGAARYSIIVNNCQESRLLKALTQLSQRGARA